MKTTISLSIIPILIVCLGLASNIQAVIPPPDGGYPGGNTAEGQHALFNLTTGTYNTAIGLYSLLSLNTGNYNTGIGAGALLSNTTGGSNTAIGALALFSNTGGLDNTATGFNALANNTTGNTNTATGGSALVSNTVGNANTAHGVNALSRNNSGSLNAAIGVNALANNTTGSDNAASGPLALLSNITGDNNTANGFGALESNTTGDGNTATGYKALVNNSIGAGNTAIGNQALDNNTSGSYNIAINGGHNLTTGIFNIAIANDGVAGESNTTRIGVLQNRCFISGIREVTTGVPDAINVMIDSAGQLGTVSSSRRFKKEIKPMDRASEAILCLKPVTFHYKSDHTARPQFGLIAEEVAKVNPNLVVHDKNGEIYSVRYDQVNAMLLNEFLKEHRRVEEQQATIAQLKREMETVVACLKEHDSKIQEVSDQVQMNGSTARVAARDQ